MTGMVGDSASRLFVVTSSNKVGVLSRPDVSADVAGYLAASSMFVSVSVWCDDAGGRRYLQLAHDRGWVAECSRKDPTRTVVAEVEDVAAAVGDPAARLFIVTSKSKVGLLPTPDVNARVSAYLAPSSVFVVLREWHDSVMGRRYLKLAHGRGWVAECSRKDPMRRVVAEVGGSIAAAGEVAGGEVVLPLDDQDDCSNEGQHREHAKRTLFDIAANATGVDTACRIPPPPDSACYVGLPLTPEKRRRKRTSPKPALLAEAAAGKPSGILPARLAMLTSAVARAFSQLQCHSVRQDMLLEYVVAGLGNEVLPFKEEELMAGMRWLENKNKIMVEQGHVILIN